MSGLVLWCLVICLAHPICPLSGNKDLANFTKTDLDGLNIRHFRQHVNSKKMLPRKIKLHKDRNRETDYLQTTDKFILVKNEEAYEDDFLNASNDVEQEEEARVTKSFDTRSVNDTKNLNQVEIPSFVAELPDTMDIVTKYLKIVENKIALGENCSAGTDHYLGDGIVDYFTRQRFRVEAEFTVTRANTLTRLWKVGILSTVFFIKRQIKFLSLHYLYTIFYFLQMRYNFNLDITMFSFCASQALSVMLLFLPILFG